MLYWETADENPSASEVELEFARIWKALPKIVFSKTLEKVEGNARLASGRRRRRGRQAEGATGKGPGRRRRRPGLDLHRAGPRRRVPALRQSGRPGRGHAVLPGPGRDGSTWSWSRRGRSALASSTSATGAPRPRSLGPWTSSSTDKVAVVTGASKGIGLAITRALADEGARWSPGARTIDALDGIERRHRGRRRPRRARRPGAAGRSARSTSTGASTCWSTTSAPSGCGSRDSSPPATRSSRGRWR